MNLVIWFLSVGLTIVHVTCSVEVTVNMGRCHKMARFLNFFLTNSGRDRKNCSRLCLIALLLGGRFPLLRQRDWCRSETRFLLDYSTTFICVHSLLYFET
jgi:hypothetical protein